MTPFEIEILLHYHVSTAPHRVEHDIVPIWPVTREWFFAEGLLEQFASMNGGSYRTTERGKAWIDYVCNLPLPEKSWKMPKDPSDAGEKGNV